jgi:hypothetical protein
VGSCRGIGFAKRYRALQVDNCNGERALNASSAESFAKAALSQNKTTDQKLELIAKALIELAKTIGSMERDISRIKNTGKDPG